MIINNQSVIQDTIKAYRMIEDLLLEGKCIELYFKDGSMLYIQQTKTWQYVYGYYPSASTKNDEWYASECNLYPSSQEIEFITYTQYYKESRSFDMIDIEKIYVGDEWSN